MKYMRNCWDLKTCPSSHYGYCEAYQKGVSCWEIKEGCLCHAYLDCNSCPIYIDHLADLEQNEN